MWLLNVTIIKILTISKSQYFSRAHLPYVGPKKNLTTSHPVVNIQNFLAEPICPMWLPLSIGRAPITQLLCLVPVYFSQVIIHIYIYIYIYICAWFQFTYHR